MARIRLGGAGEAASATQAGVLRRMRFQNMAQQARRDKKAASEQAIAQARADRQATLQNQQAQIKLQLEIQDRILARQQAGDAAAKEREKLAIAGRETVADIGQAGQTKRTKLGIEGAATAAAKTRQAALDDAERARFIKNLDDTLTDAETRRKEAVEAEAAKKIALAKSREALAKRRHDIEKVREQIKAEKAAAVIARKNKTDDDKTVAERDKRISVLRQLEQRRRTHHVLVKPKAAAFKKGKVPKEEDAWAAYGLWRYRDTNDIRWLEWALRQPGWVPYEKGGTGSHNVSASQIGR